MDSDILLTISAGVITHQPSAGIWHCTSEANYIKSLGFWTSNGPFVLCTSIWHLCFPRTITGPLLLLLSVLEFWLAQNKLAVFNSNSDWESIFHEKEKQKIKHRRETVPCGASTLSTSSQEHGTPSQLQWLNSKENIWVFLQSSSKTDHCLQTKLPPKASSWGFLDRTKWGRKHCRQAYSSLLHICKSSTLIKL